MVIRSYFQQMHPHVGIRWLKQLHNSTLLPISFPHQDNHLGEGHSQAEEAPFEAGLCPGCTQMCTMIILEDTTYICPGGEEMAGEPTSSVLAVLCSLLWKEGSRLLDGQGGDAEEADTARAGGSLQVNVQN